MDLLLWARELPPRRPTLPHLLATTASPLPTAAAAAAAAAAEAAEAAAAAPARARPRRDERPETGLDVPELLQRQAAILLTPPPLAGDAARVKHVLTSLIP